MSNPQRSRNLALIACAVGFMMAIAAFVLPLAMAGNGVRATLFCIGVTGVLFGGGTAWWKHHVTRAKAALARGEGIVARWQVDAATWRAFCDAEAQARNGLPNVVDVADAEAATGFAVVVGEEAIDIGGSLHLLPRRGMPEVVSATLHDGGVGQPDWIDLRLHYPEGGTGASGAVHGAMDTRLAFPVAGNAWREARMVEAFYARGRPGPAGFLHGAGDGSDPEDLGTCWSCGYRTHQFRSICPQCGSSLQSRRWSRRLGSVLLVLGLLISGTMAAVIAYLWPALRHPGRRIDGTTFAGGEQDVLVVSGILLAVLAFGLIATGYGTWQIVTGKRSPRVVLVMIAIFGALGVVAWWL